MLLTIYSNKNEPNESPDIDISYYELICNQLLNIDSDPFTLNANIKKDSVFKGYTDILSYTKNYIYTIELIYNISKENTYILIKNDMESYIYGRILDDEGYERSEYERSEFSSSESINDNTNLGINKQNLDRKLIGNKVKLLGYFYINNAYHINIEIIE